jgi:putative toxin-antitoxin system antitoxin component (TIGR02293 family)
MLGMYAEAMDTGSLGLRTRGRSPLAIVEKVEEGLPISSLERLVKRLAPGDAQFIYRFIPRATFTRRKAKHGAKLTLDEGNRVTAVAKVWDFAVEIYRNEERARAFMHRPHPLLEGRKPIDVAVATSVGADLVYELLGQALYGVAV